LILPASKHFLLFLLFFGAILPDPDEISPYAVASIV